jgi:hypothetical protein
MQLMQTPPKRVSGAYFSPFHYFQAMEYNWIFEPTRQGQVHQCHIDTDMRRADFLIVHHLAIKTIYDTVTFGHVALH